MVAYTKEKTIEDIENAMQNWGELYNSNAVNRIGATSDTGEAYTEIAAQKILERIGELKSSINISIVRRGESGKSYKVEGHKWKAFDENPDLPRKEERKAKSFMKETIPGLGTVLDYQIPLYAVSKKKSGLRLGKIDMVAITGDKRTFYLIEYKWRVSNETLLRCVLEAYTYSQIVDGKQLLSDFDYPEATLRKAVLAYKSTPKHKCQPYLDFHADCPNVRRLMRELGVDFFVLSESVSESYLCDTL